MVVFQAVSNSSFIISTILSVVVSADGCYSPTTGVDDDDNGIPLTHVMLDLLDGTRRLGRSTAIPSFTNG
jgi:hypothetical protein